MIKIYWSNDNFIAFSNDDLRFLNNLFAKHKYDYNIILSDKINITSKAVSTEREKNVVENVIKDLCVNLFKVSGRNIDCDNFFPSYNLDKSLMMDNNLSI